jgi:hypothetical protein
LTDADLSFAAGQPAAAYEALRAAVLSGHSNGERGLAILVHRGLAAWAGELKPEAPPASPSSTTPGPSIRSAAPASTPNELTRVLAGIIVALTTGDIHAHA